jgi:ABC-type multidrug transport system ATPase subunit
MKVNGVRRTLSEFRDVCGFVPQDDIMHTDLKVRELLTQPHANLVIYCSAADLQLE